MSSQHSGSSPPNAAQGYTTQLLLLSDDHTLTQLVESLITVAQQNIETVCLPSRAFSPEQSLTADLILIDRHYGGRPPHWVIEAINHMYDALGVQPSRKVLLCDQHMLEHDLAQMAALARLGIDEFLLKDQLSFARLFDSGRHSSPQITSAPSTQHLGKLENNHSSLGFGDTAQPPHATNVVPAAAPGFLENIAPPHDMATPQDSGNPHWNPHKLYLDIENQWLKIDIGVADQLIDRNIQLPLEDWKQKLSASSAKAIEVTLDKAINYHKLPATVALEFAQEELLDSSSECIRAELANIRTENNGQGRVVALNATLRVEVETSLQPEPAAYPAGEAAIDSAQDAAAAAMTADSIARSLPMACLVLDADGIVQSIVSDAIFRTGLLPTPEPGDNLQQLLGEQEQGSLTHEIKRCLNTGQSYHGVISYSAESGLRWFETQITKIIGGTGLARQVIWSAFDISESRESYMELSKKEDSLSQILANAPFLFFEKDSNGHYRRANQAYCTLLSVEESALIGRRDKDLFTDELCKYLQSLEQFVRQNENEGSVFEEAVPANLRENFGAIYWRSRVMKYRFGDGVESLLAFGISVKQSQRAEEPQTQRSGDVTAIATRADTANQAVNNPPNFQGSGSLKQDFKAMLSSLVNYTEMAVSQKNELRNQKLVEQLDSLQATVVRAKALISSNRLREDQEDASESLKYCNMQRLTEEIIEMQKPTLPASLDFQTSLMCEDVRGLVEAEDYQKIVLQLISSARDTALRRQASVAGSDNSAQGLASNPGSASIELTLKAVTTNAVCSACEESIVGEFIELGVHTTEQGFGEEDLKALIKQAKIAVQRATDSRGQTNVMALTHQQQGHSLIAYDNGLLSLKLLFKKEIS